MSFVGRGYVDPATGRTVRFEDDEYYVLYDAELCGALRANADAAACVGHAATEAHLQATVDLVAGGGYTVASAATASVVRFVSTIVGEGGTYVSAKRRGGEYTILNGDAAPHFGAFYSEQSDAAPWRR
jgi:hypothetical protein